MENIVYFELLRRSYEIAIDVLESMRLILSAKRRVKKSMFRKRELSQEDTIEREFRPLLLVKDNYPKYVISTDEFDMSQYGIIHRNIFDFLLDDEI